MLPQALLAVLAVLAALVPPDLEPTSVVPAESVAGALRTLVVNTLYNLPCLWVTWAFRAPINISGA